MTDDNNLPSANVHRAEWLSVPLTELLGPVLTEESLLESSIASEWWWLGIPVLMSFGLIFMIRQKPRQEKIRLTEGGFQYRKKDYPTAQDSLRLIHLLLHSDGPVSNTAVMELVGNSSLDYSYNTRIKNQLVDKTNALLKSILQIQEDLILCDRSDRDKRARTYTIRREFFN